MQQYTGKRRKEGARVCFSPVSGTKTREATCYQPTVHESCMMAPGDSYSRAYTSIHGDVYALIHVKYGVRTVHGTVGSIRIRAGHDLF